MYSSKFYASDIDYIINISKNEIEPKIYSYKQSTKLHQTEKPKELMMELIKDTVINITPNVTVLDTFSGVATTLKACYGLGINGIGYEIEENIYEVGKSNLTEGGED